MLVTLSDGQLNQILPIGTDGRICFVSRPLANLIAAALDSPAPRIALEAADCFETTSGEPVEATRSARGLWWAPVAEDRARVGTWTIDGRALTVATEGERPSPVSDNSDLLRRATDAIVDDLTDADVVRPGVVSTDGGRRTIRVFVVRDARVTRVEDLLSPLEIDAYKCGTLGVASLLMTADGAALLRRSGW